MVSVEPTAPQFVLEGDVEAYIDRADPDQPTRQKLREADDDGQVRLLARAWYSRFHGSPNEAKRLFVLLMEERGIPYDGEDIQAITGRPPVETQT